jgi:hypothetical protein
MGFALHMGMELREIAGRLVVLTLAVLPCLAAADSSEGKATNAWDHYQVIVDKNPFGRLGPGPVEVTPDFAKNMRLCMLSQIPDTTKPGRFQVCAGFVGPAITNQFTLREGELTEDGFSLDDVNYAEQSVKLRKGTETAVFTVQGLPVPSNTLMRTQQMLGYAPQLPPDAWKIYHEATRRSSGELIPAHVHLPGAPEGSSNRTYLSDDQVTEFRRLRAQNPQPNLPFPR